MKPFHIPTSFRVNCTWRKRNYNSLEQAKNGARRLWNLYRGRLQSWYNKYSPNDLPLIDIRKTSGDTDEIVAVCTDNGVQETPKHASTWKSFLKINKIK